MKRQDHIKLEALSQLDDEVISRNVQKRHLLLHGVKLKKRITRSMIAMAAVFALIVASVFMFLPDNSHVAPPSDKQVPIYQGMTVSNEAPVAQMASNARVNLTLFPPMFGAIGARFGTSSIPGTSTTPKPDKVTPEISGGPYYAQPNEDIYIYVHISNPDGFEILSFTLNGVKYSTYMFEAGSNLETLILKYNVGEKEGVQQYTIDAIKYVDGEQIKDVRMEGERTIEVLVGNDAQDLTFTTQFDGWDLVITPKWAGTFAGEKKIHSLAVYEGERLLRDLTPSTTVIRDLPVDKRLLLVATYLDNGKTVTVKTVFQTLKESEGLIVVGGVVTGIGTFTDTVLYINMPIADDAFNNNKYITQVYLGSGATSIGKRTFMMCESLKTVNISNSVTSIGNNAFSDCGALESVTIGDGVTSIGEYAFSGCSSLTNITIPDSVTSIDMLAFNGCKSLQSITISNSVTRITHGAFSDCDSLTSITIPNSVKTIDIYAFNNCSKLTSITLPNSVTSIGDRAFSYCSGLTSINYAGTQEQWNAVTKYETWNLSTPKITVHCSDGDVIE